MYYTKSITYNLLPNDSLNEIRAWAETHRDPYSNPVWFNKPNVYKKTGFRPYINLIKPILDKFEEKNLKPEFASSSRIDPNSSKIGFMYRGGSEVNTIVYVPLRDYSRNEKIWTINKRQYGFNTTFIVDKKMTKSIHNNSNNIYSFLVFGLQKNYNDVIGIL